MLVVAVAREVVAVEVVEDGVEDGVLVVAKGGGWVAAEVEVEEVLKGDRLKMVE